MTTNENPLLKNLTMPGKRYRMPSRGLFYNDGELAEDVKEGEVEIFSMTTLDEISLRSPEFLFSGEAIEKVFSRCIPEILKPLKLLSHDVDYLLTCLRIVSYGGILPIEDRCTECEKTQMLKNNKTFKEFVNTVKTKAEEQNVKLELAMQDEAVKDKIEKINSKQSQKESYNIDLTSIISNKTTEIDEDNYKKHSVILSNGQTVHLTPLKLDSAVMAFKFQNEDLSADLSKVEDYIAFLLTSRIQAVNDIRDIDLIEEWVRKLPVKLKNELNDKAEKITKWGTDFNYNVDCGTCGHTRNINTLLNPINFFIIPSK